MLVLGRFVVCITRSMPHSDNSAVAWDSFPVSVLRKCVLDGMSSAQGRQFAKEGSSSGACMRLGQVDLGHDKRRAQFGHWGGIGWDGGGTRSYL